MKLTEQSAQALANLRAHPDFVVFLQWLAENRTKFRDECCTYPPETVLRPQGKVDVVDGIFRAVREAPKTVEKMKSQLS